MGLGLRWPVVAAAFALSLVALMGGYQLYQKYQIQLPVERRIVATGLAAEVAWVEPGKEVSVRLRPVGDLCQAYGELQRAAGPGVVVRIADRATPELEALYRRVEPALYEAAALNNFTSMAKRVESVAREGGLDTWAVRIDENRIYLQFSLKGSYLYRVIPRRWRQEV